MFCQNVDFHACVSRLISLLETTKVQGHFSHTCKKSWHAKFLWILPVADFQNREETHTYTIVVCLAFLHFQYAYSIHVQLTECSYAKCSNADVDTWPCQLHYYLKTSFSCFKLWVWWDNTDQVRHHSSAKLLDVTKKIPSHIWSCLPNVAFGTWNIRLKS